MTTRRPTHRDLRALPLTDVLPIGRAGQRVMTMCEGQWNGILSAAYEQGWVLLELDEDEQPVRAYRKANL
jgi:hypothetical protein